MATIRTASVVAGRAVHIKIHPRPRNLAESRQVLRVLERYGEVVMFKHLKYEPQAPAPNSALAIYRYTTGAEKAMKASPMRFVFGTSEGKVKEYGLNAGDENQRRDDQRIGIRSDSTQEATRQVVEDSIEDQITGVKRPISDADDAAIKELKDRKPWGTTFPSVQALSNPPPEPSPVPPDSTPPSSSVPVANPPLPFPLPSSSVQIPSSIDDPQPPLREVQIHVSPSTLNHQAYISRQGYYSGFRVSNKTIMAEDLEGRVPVFGMVDLRMDKEETPIRIRVKRDEVGNQKALPRLRELWEAGIRKRTGGSATTA
ncbi:MAG: hypothetical protein Q9187_005356 [Circinaria calcarea]